MVEAAWSRHQKLLAFARQRVPTQEDAEDLVQNLYAYLPRLLDGDPAALPTDEDAFISCLYGFLRRMAANRTRKLRRRLELRHAFPLDLASSTELRRRIESSLYCAEVLDRLPPDDAQLLRWRYLEGLSYQEIAERLGISNATARKRVQRVLETAQGIVS